MSEMSEMIEPIKTFVVGPSGAGKTGALVSLLLAGYNVRIVDLDNGTKIIRNLLRSSPAALERLSVVTLTERMKPVNGRIVPVTAKVWQKATMLLADWKDEAGNSFGSVEKWTPQDVLAFDSFSTLGTAALNYYLALNGKLQEIPTGNEYRRNIGAAQGMLINLLELLFCKEVNCNIVLNTHITYSKRDGTMPTEAERALAEKEKRPITLFGFPSLIGKAAGPTAPKYFNDLLYIRPSEELGVKARIWTVPQDNIGVKTSAPGLVKPSYSVETGLAEYFAAVRGTKV